MKALKLLLALAIFLPMTATGQDSTKTSTSSPVKTFAEMTEKDLNNDGINDIVFIFEGPFTHSVTLEIWLSNSDGSRQEPKFYENILFELPADFDDNSVSYDLGMTDDNCLKISVTLDYSMSGSYAVPTGTYIYRYQDGDFYLISDTHTDLYANTGEEFSVINDYLKGKRCDISITADKNKNLKRKEKWNKIGKKPLHRLGEDKLTAE